jgi:hypothetical protein
MAKRSRNSQSAAELKEKAARSRELVRRGVIRVREELDFPRKVRRSIRRQPAGWIVGAIAVGLVLTALIGRRKKIYLDSKTGAKSKNTLLEAGFILGALRVAAGLLKPVIVNLVEKKLGSSADLGRRLGKGF